MRLTYTPHSIAEGILQTRPIFGQTLELFQDCLLTHIIDHKNKVESPSTYLYLGRFPHLIAPVSNNGFFILKDIIDLPKLYSYLAYQKELMTRMNQKSNVIEFKKR